MSLATSVTSEPTAVAADKFRALMRRFATGVTVVTCPGPGGPEGITVNAFTPLSLRPPRVLVCLDRGSRTLRTILVAGNFAVNVLGWERRELAARFADTTRTPSARFAGIHAAILVTGAPVIPDSLAVLDCLLSRAWPCGDHVLVVGDFVDGMAGSTDEPLVFFGGRFCSSSDRRQDDIDERVDRSSP